METYLGWSDIVCICLVEYSFLFPMVHSYNNWPTNARVIVENKVAALSGHRVIKTSDSWYSWLFSTVTSQLLTEVCRWLHCVRSRSRISYVCQKVDTWLHQSDLKTEKIVAGSVVKMEPSHAKQPVQSPVPAVQVILIQLIYHNTTSWRTFWLGM